MKRPPNPTSLFTLIQFLALVLIVCSWTIPTALSNTDSDFEGHLGSADGWLLEQHRTRQARDVRWTRTWGTSCGFLILAAATVGVRTCNRSRPDA